ncbi:toll/interleukin-1 receptor domain-containing protein [Nonomuraea aurantiaca]|uniref:toll/interleukin-1 receptor domain-containing protein n=1 Tax=Nonomuraea aurantiaca TaxID=2878562 RepID=UPI001CD92E91|nr:toll/interleukin-1 receptor domain-containing protein [Nonomuraea aurantiaca]MCA2220026.1 TIR domain-containing protein [Nonomuraea aurantiaca]
MTGVFINYRNQDEPWAAGLIDVELCARFGKDNVFRASRSVEAGDFQPQILDRLHTSSALVAVIGSGWASVRGEGGRPRLEEPEDWVRREIEIALAEGIPIIPVLVNAQMPARSAIPESIGELTVQNHTRLHHRTLETDLERLARMIERLLPELGLRDVVGKDRRPPRTNRPSALLDPREKVVPFRDRGGDADTLTDRCRDVSDSPAILLTGPAGVGKTRLAVEVCRRLEAENWTVGFVPPGLPAETLRRVRKARGPALLVVDEAETRTTQIDAVLTAVLGRSPNLPRVAVLALARTPGDWFEEIQDVEWGGLLAPSVAQMELTAGDGATEYTWALRAYARELRMPVPELAERKTGFGTPLEAHEAALSDLLGTSGSADLLARERVYWNHLADLYELLDPHRARCAQVLAVGCLFGADDDAEAVHTLSLLPTFRGGEPNPESVQRYADWARGVYPGDKALNGTPSASLTRGIVVDALRRTPTLLDMLGEVSDRQAVRALGVLAGVLDHHPRLAPELVAALRAAPARLLPLCVVVAAATPLPDPFVAAMTEALDGLDDAPLAEVTASLPQRSVTLGTYALACEGLAWRRSSGEEAVRLGLRFAARAVAQSARLEEARSAAEVAVSALLGGVAAAEAYATLALVRDALGQSGEAIEAGERAVEAYRSEGNPGKAGLTTALHNQAVRTRVAGVVEKAHAYAREAVLLATALAEDDRRTYTSLLADTLDNLGAAAAQNGDLDEALIEAEKAVALRRELSARRPDAYVAALAGALNSLGVVRRLAGDRDGARRVLEEAVNLLGPWVKRHPERFADDLTTITRNRAALGDEPADSFEPGEPADPEKER